jgi:hypothetical protein
MFCSECNYIPQGYKSLPVKMARIYHTSHIRSNPADSPALILQFLSVIAPIERGWGMSWLTGESDIPPTSAGQIADFASS